MSKIGLVSEQEAKEALDDMQILFNYINILNIIDYCVFDLSLARGLDYYTGLIYEAALTDTDRVGSIAGGGRYDDLVGMFSSKTIPAVGVSIGIERIFNILEDNLKVIICLLLFRIRLEPLKLKYLSPLLVRT